MKVNSYKTQVVLECSLSQSSDLLQGHSHLNLAVTIFNRDDNNRHYLPDTIVLKHFGWQAGLAIPRLSEGQVWLVVLIWHGAESYLAVQRQERSILAPTLACGRWCGPTPTRTPRSSGDDPAPTRSCRGEGTWPGPMGKGAMAQPCGKGGMDQPQPSHTGGRRLDPDMHMVKVLEPEPTQCHQGNGVWPSPIHHRGVWPGLIPPQWWRKRLDMPQPAS